MKHSQYTPGPWRAEKTYCNRHEIFEGDETKRVPQRIAIVSLTNCDVWKGTEGADKANASLIAAAPELLEALEICLGNMTGGMDGKWPPDIDPIEAAREAIAKALGK